MNSTVNKSGIPLSYIGEGKRVQIIRIDGSDRLKSRLNAIGFVPKTEVFVVKNSTKGPLVISIKGSKIAIGSGIAHKIIVA